MVSGSRFLIASLPYSSAARAWWRVEDFKPAPQLGLLVLEAGGSNYRTYTSKVLLSAGAKQALKKIEKGEAEPVVREYFNNDYINTTSGELIVYNVNLAFERREGKLPKLYVPQEPVSGGWMMLVKYGGGYRGSFWRYLLGAGEITKLVSVSGGGSLGDVEIALIHAERAPFMVAVYREGRLYGAPAWSYLLVTDESMVVGMATRAEIREIVDMYGLEPRGTDFEVRSFKYRVLS